MYSSIESRISLTSKLEGGSGFSSQDDVYCCRLSSIYEVDNSCSWGRAEVRPAPAGQDGERREEVKLNHLSGRTDDTEGLDLQPAWSNIPHCRDGQAVGWISCLGVAKGGEWWVTML